MARVSGRPVGNRVALLVLGAAGAATAAVSLTTVNAAKDYAVAESLAGRPIRVAGALGVLGAPDVAAVLLAALACAGVLWLEWRARAYTRLLATLTEPQAVALLLGLLAWLGHAYGGGGVLLGGDTGTHVSRFAEVARGLAEGTLAQWTNDQYAGAPLLWFTGPLPYVVGGALAFALGDAVAATKLFLFGFHMLGGWLLYVLLRRFGFGRLAAVVAAAGFAGAFAHLHLFLYRGVVPQALTIVFLVLLFLAADTVMRPGARRWPGALGFAVATAGLILNHQPHALFAAAYLALFGAGALALGRWHWRGLPVLAAFGLLGALAGLVAVLPVLAEADWVMIEPEGAAFGLRLPTADRLLDLVLWRNTRTTWGIDYWAYLGAGPLLFGLAGLVGLIRGPRAAAARGVVLPALACLLLGLFLFNPVVRDVIFILFFLGIAAASGLDWLQQRGVLTGRGLLLAVAVALLDLASTAVQPVMRNDKQFLIEAGRVLERTTPPTRVVQLEIGPDGRLEADLGPDGGPVSYRSAVQRIAGNHNMAATRLHNVLLVTAKQVEIELQTNGTLSDDTRAMLAMLDVGRVICTSPVANGCPAEIEDAVEDKVLGRHLRTLGRPALFSQHLVRMEPAEGVQKPMLWPGDLVDSADTPRLRAIRGLLHQVVATEAAEGGPVAAAIPVRAVPEGIGPQPVAPGWAPSVLDYAVIPTLVDQDPCAQSRCPMDMMVQGCSTSLFQA